MNYDSQINGYAVQDCLYIGDAPDLPGCMAFGSTLSELYSQMSVAIEVYLQAKRRICTGCGE